MSTIKRISAALKKRWGSAESKQNVWDAEYSTGHWDYDPAKDSGHDQDPIYGFLDRYCSGKSILDLGCGKGMTALEMAPGFREYMGVDISSVAVDQAISALSSASDRAGKMQFAVSDIFSYEPTIAYSVILFRESIYYVPQNRISGMLARYRQSLTEDGVFLVRLCDRSRYKKIIDILNQEFSIIESYAPPESKMAILVCSPTIKRSLQ
jgi:SAM-dependent methyltransferase